MGPPGPTLGRGKQGLAGPSWSPGPGQPARRLAVVRRQWTRRGLNMHGMEARRGERRFRRIGGASGASKTTSLFLENHSLAAAESHVEVGDETRPGKGRATRHEARMRLFGLNFGLAIHEAGRNLSTPGQYHGRISALGGKWATIARQDQTPPLPLHPPTRLSPNSNSRLRRPSLVLKSPARAVVAAWLATHPASRWRPAFPSIPHPLPRPAPRSRTPPSGGQSLSGGKNTEPLAAPPCSRGWVFSTLVIPPLLPFSHVNALDSTGITATGLLPTKWTLPTRTASTRRP